MSNLLRSLCLAISAAPSISILLLLVTIAADAETGTARMSSITDHRTEAELALANNRNPRARYLLVIQIVALTALVGRAAAHVHVVSAAQLR